MYLIGHPTFSNVIVRANSAIRQGGGIYCGSGASWSGGNSSNNLIVEDNTARTGGGIYFNSVSDNYEERTLTNFTVKGNEAILIDGYGGEGGGIYDLGSQLHLSNVVIDSNMAVYAGGGLFSTNTSNLQMSDAQISRNSAQDGGGIHGVGNSTINLSNNVDISENSAIRGGGIAGHGSGFYLIMKNGTITDNAVDTVNYSSDGGGAIYLFGGPTINLNDVIIDGNSSIRSGGAIKCRASKMILSNVSITNNQAHNPNDEWSSYYGGGIYMVVGAQAWLNEVKIDGNYASYSGGGISSGFDSQLYINSSAVTNNTSGVANSNGYGAGIALNNTTGVLSGVTISNNGFQYTGSGSGLHCSESDMPLVNSIVWANGESEDISISGGNIPVSFSDIQGGEAGISGSVEWGFGNIDMDPLFENPANGNFHLQPSSPAINSGNPDVIYTNSNGSRRDMGAFGGNGLAANFSQYEFGTVDVREQTIDWKIYNFRETSVTIDSAMLTHPDFELIDHASLFPLIVEPFTSANLTIQFDPTAGDSISAELRLRSADFVGDAPVIVEFNGVGYLPFAAEFEADVTSGEAPLSVQFTDLSLGDSLSWSWDFDNDGTMDSHEQNPLWIYQSAGLFSVTLAISDSLRTDTLTMIDFIEVFPSNSPMITSISDVPEDQGGWVYVSWSASALDDSAGISYYRVWGHDDSLEDWDVLATVPAIQTNEYTFLASTNADSSDTGVFWSKFMISAHPPLLTVLYESEIDSGYSVDNIYPGVPTGPMAVVTDNLQIQLDWESVLADDIRNYRIYRSHSISFVPDSESLIGETVANTFLDETVMIDEVYYYQISAVDIHGNESDFSEEISANVVSLIDEVLPDVFVLEQNFPNPFNPSTTLRYGIPEETNVSLVIYDIQGNLVKKIASGSKSAGWHSYEWDGSDDSGHLVSTGLYLARLETRSYSRTIKMLYLK
ncbi:MAG: T9SS type A sorting domain-containing protein [Candidatus Marinimicrobia bacterium]|nr:T9SS type A sorting domain-containing protein [Candidatus Neomarinimicrobiota bacterium]